MYFFCVLVLVFAGGVGGEFSKGKGGGGDEYPTFSIYYLFLCLGGRSRSARVWGGGLIESAVVG